MKRHYIKSILLFILVFLLCLALFSTYWALDTFNFYSFDEVLFQLTTPIKSASSSILESYLINSLTRSIILSILFFILLQGLYNYLNNNNKNSIKRIVSIIILLLTIFIFYHCLDKVKFTDFVKNETKSSTFIEDHYINPDDVNISFPDEKRNLIYIYVESLESTYFSEELGGGSKNNYITPLKDITSDNINFSDSNKFGGAVMAKGSEWTSGAIVAHTTGLPLKPNSIFGYTDMLSKATGLGNILKDNGYNQMFMIGSDKDFGNRAEFFKNHGDYEIYDYNTAIEKEKIDKDYKVWWGYEDSKLFEYAKEEIVNLEEPFNFTMLTANTHTKGGFVEDNCPKIYDDNYTNSIYCSSLQVVDFINWIKEQDFYSNTTIVIVGDHVSMEEDLYPDNTNRRVYNLFINPYISSDKTNNRVFSTMDLFPTTLASLGADIEGDRLGLGTNLFSDNKTLMEEYGIDKVNNELKKHSNFYNNTFFK